MQSMQIVSGFSDLKRQFRLKVASDKSFADLRFHFTAENEFLAMHDFQNHRSLMVLALYKPEARTWRIFVEDPSLGMNLIKYVTSSGDSAAALKLTRELYQLYGFGF